jgi:hypothetical protein
MKQKFRMLAIHQTVWYPALDESNRMKSAYFTIHPVKILLKMVAGWNRVVF